MRRRPPRNTRADVSFSYTPVFRWAGDAIGVRSYIVRAGPGVERNEVHLGWQPVFADQPHQFARVVVAVVLPFEHHIFKGDAPRIIGTGIGGAGGQQLLDAVFLVDGHDLVAHLLGDRVQRDGEVDADLLARARHHRSEEHTSELQSLLRI